MSRVELGTFVRRGARASWAFVRALPRLLLIGIVRFYQLVISPWTPPTCKYYPSCSSYAVTALTRHGALRGSWLAARRLGRCHPWSDGGVDDVPPVGYWRHEHEADGAVPPKPHAHPGHVHALRGQH